MDIDISNIKKHMCHDGHTRYVLDSNSKIIHWIQYNLEIQKKQAQKYAGRTEQVLDLSNCIISNDKSSNEKVFRLLYLIKDTKLAGLDYFDSNGYDHMTSTRIVNYKFICNNSIFYYADFQRTTFFENVEFENTKYINAVYMHNCIFKKYTSFKGAQFISFCDFSLTAFAYTIFDKCVFDADIIHFLGCDFKEDVSFNSVLFTEQLDCHRTRTSFMGCKFEKSVLFNNIIFTRECDFSNSLFQGQCEFVDCKFMFPVLFDNATINFQLIFYKENNEYTYIVCISFKNSTINGRLEFIRVKSAKFIGNNILIEKKGYLRFGRSSIESLDLCYAVNKGVILLQNNNSSIKCIDFSNGMDFGKIEIESSKITPKNRHTARIMKDSAYKCNNIIDALFYKKIEYSFYKKELKKIYIDIFTKTMKNCNFSNIKELKNLPLSESILLCLNNISNNYGISWIRGLIFTFIVSIFFYSLFSFSTGSFVYTNDVLKWSIFHQKYWIGVLNFLWLPTIVSSKKLNLISYVLLIFGKIMVAYGVYQTISAFRKYGK